MFGIFVCLSDRNGHLKGFQLLAYIFFGMFFIILISQSELTVPFTDMVYFLIDDFTFKSVLVNVLNNSLTLEYKGS